jgi:anthranilate synthase component 2
MILVIDNYDSFTYNLVQYLAELGATVEVRRNDQVTVAEAAALAPEGIVISPGPGHPEDAGISSDLIRALGPRLPILGVCLGHQCIGQVYGGRIVGAPELMHGKTSAIHHRSQGVFARLNDPFEATRYHSLVIDRADFPEVLEVTAWCADGTIMGVRHRVHGHIQGVQFHPESILTHSGKELFRNFLDSISAVPA